MDLDPSSFESALLDIAVIGSLLAVIVVGLIAWRRRR